MCRVLRNPLSAVVALILLLGIPLNASADQITLLATVDSITLTGAGTLVNVFDCSRRGGWRRLPEPWQPEERHFHLGRGSIYSGAERYGAVSGRGQHPEF